MYPSTRSRWRSATRGPIWVLASKGSPTRTWEKALARASTISSCRLRLTTMRVSEEQTWPVSHALGTGQRGRRCRDVHVVEDDGGRLPAELEGASGDPLAADRRDAPARGRGAGEGDLVDPGITDQQLGDLPVGGDDIEDARREPDRFGDLGHHVPLGRGLR